MTQYVSPSAEALAGLSAPNMRLMETSCMHGLVAGAEVILALVHLIFCSSRKFLKLARTEHSHTQLSTSV